VRLHTHIAETMDEDAFSRETFGMSPIELLESLQWLGPDVWLAHCVHPLGGDIGRLAASRSCVAHCPTSNMLLGSGLAPVRPMLDAGVSVGLGVDGSASNDANDLRNEVKQAVLVARVRDGACAMTVRSALRLATRGGAECLGRDDIGSLQPGMMADIALFDTRAIDWAGGLEDPVAALVLGASRPHTVMVHGRIVVEAGRPRTVDLDDVVLSQNEHAGRLMERAHLRA
jgi:cytosine/adenosine deaminase-related metal-dependent hydrolase